MNLFEIILTGFFCSIFLYLIVKVEDNVITWIHDKKYGRPYRTIRFDDFLEVYNSENHYYYHDFNLWKNYITYNGGTLMFSKEDLKRYKKWHKEEQTNIRRRNSERAYSDFQKKMKDVDFYRQRTKMKENRTPVTYCDKPYEITENEYEHDRMDFGKRILFVYDNACTGELTFAPIDDETMWEYVGKDLLDMARNMIPEQRMWVRNPEIELDMELRRVEGNYEG